MVRNRKGPSQEKMDRISAQIERDELEQDEIARQETLIHLGSELAELVLAALVLCTCSRSNAPCFDEEDYEARDASGPTIELRQDTWQAIVTKAREFQAKAQGRK